MFRIKYDKLGNIYVLRKKNEKGDPTVKIGSTMMELVIRILQYRTPEKDFNNDTHDLWKFEIKKSDYNCYQIDDMIQKMSIEKEFPYKKYKGLGGGKEHYYFNNDIHKIDEFLKFYNIEAKCEKIDINKLEKEMQNLNEKETKKEIDKEDEKKEKITKSVDIKKLLEIYNKKNMQISSVKNPREDQKIILNESINHFEKNDKGILILMCGVGKTLISLWICQLLKMNKILVGVPNILLLEQWEKEIKSVFYDTNILLVKSGIKKEDIEEYLNKNNNKCIVITSYASCHKVFSATVKNNFQFDMKINDECHHLTTSNMQEEGTTKTYIEMIHIKSKKQLSLTATIKYLENTINDNITISNSSVEYFGEIITRRNLLWAIQKGILCDYIVQTIITDKFALIELLKKFKIEEENLQRLFLSAYSTLKSINDNNSHHLLIYSNKIENAEKILEYIGMLLKDKYFVLPDLYCSTYDGEMKTKTQLDILKKFKHSKCGIICCVYCLGEGWDFPLLNGVVIAENMSANIRIVQSALRASRKNINEPNKITKIILPILNRDDWLDNSENSDFKKVREVIYQLSLEDETILTKLKVCKINIEKHGPPKPKNLIDELSKFGEYEEELTQNLKLKSIPRYALDTTYEKAKKIISEKMIKIRNKDDYCKVCDIDVRLPKDPEERFKGKFDWIDYLGINGNFYEYDECKEKINKYLTDNIELKKKSLNLDFICKELCKIDEKFPPYGLWIEYYKIKSLDNIININLSKKKSFLL
jgi:predicted helicase